MNANVHHIYEYVITVIHRACWVGAMHTYETMRLITAILPFILHSSYMSITVAFITYVLLLLIQISADTILNSWFKNWVTNPGILLTNEPTLLELLPREQPRTTKRRRRTKKTFLLIYMDVEHVLMNFRQPIFGHDDATYFM